MLRNDKISRCSLSMEKANERGSAIIDGFAAIAKHIAGSINACMRWLIKSLFTLNYIYFIADVLRTMMYCIDKYRCIMAHKTPRN